MATANDGNQVGNRGGQAAKPGPARGGDPITKKVVEVFHNPRPDKIVDAWVGDAPGVPKDSFVITVLAQKGTPPEQITIHRPIGHTDLSPGDWVATPTTDVHYLVSAAEDPREAQIAAAEAVELLQFATEGGSPILLKDGAIYRYVNVEGKPSRDATLRKADQDLRNAIAIQRAEFDKAQEGKSTKGRFKHDLRREQFLSKEVLDAEAELRALRKRRAADIAAKVPRTYRTMGGPLHDRPQKRIPWIKSGATALEARREVYLASARLLIEGKSLDGALNPAVDDQEVQLLRTQVREQANRIRALEALAKLAAEELETSSDSGGTSATGTSPDRPAPPKGAGRVKELARSLFGPGQAPKP